MMVADTIFALATASGRSALAVIRISGPGTEQVLKAVAGRVPAPRKAVRARLRDRFTDETIDHGLVVWFPAPRSYTGEDVAELQFHGGRAVVSELYRVLSGFDGVRPAEPGEFTRRAFRNGKFDLTAAEGIADLVAAETTEQRRQALRQAEGALGALYEGWRTSLVGVLAHVEAAIDFADDEVPASVLGDARNGASALHSEILGHLDDKRHGEMLREGIHVAVLGEPNVGKSSLVNQLARRDIAITSSTAGTTRDVIEVRLDIGGFPLIVADTAGLRAVADPIEAEGVRRAVLRSQSADLKLIVADATRPEAIGDVVAAQIDERAIMVLNKVDLVASAPATVRGLVAYPVDSLTGRGFRELLGAIEDRSRRLMGEGPQLSLTRERHRAALGRCVVAIGRAMAATDAEIVAEDLRIALREIGRITGRVQLDEILDVVFRDFCIGK